MALDAIYELAPRWLQCAAVNGMGAYLRWQRFGGEYPRLRAEAERAAMAGPEEVDAIQRRLWSRWVRPAAAAVAAYGQRSLEFDELSSLPILSKAEVRARLGSFVRPGYPRARRVKAHTSGSTGAGLQFLVPLRTIRRDYAFVWRYRNALGIPFGEVCGVFGGRPIVPSEQRDPPYWRVNAPGRTVLYSQYHLKPETAARYLEDLRRRKLRWIHGYPSVVSLLAQLGIEAGLAGSTHVSWVTVSSENLLESHRHAIRRMFGVAPRQQYGMTEAVAMFSECPQGRLHVDEDYSRVEFVAAPEIPGACRIVGTTLDNDLFPLLRYQVGDIVRLTAPGACPCGRQGRIVASIDGRQEDFLVLSDGSRVGRVDHFFKDAVHVVEAQIVQRAPGEATIRIVRGPGYTERDEGALRADIQRRMGGRLRARFEYVDQLPRTRMGKLRLVVSELPEARTERLAESAG